MSFVRDQCAIMSQLQIDMARESASVPPPPFSPSPLPNLQDTERHGGGDLPFVSQNTGD